MSFKSQDKLLLSWHTYILLTEELILKGTKIYNNIDRTSMTIFKSKDFGYTSKF